MKKQRHREAGEWVYGPWVGYKRGAIRHRYWVPADKLESYRNPQPPRGGGDVHTRKARRLFGLRIR